MIVTIVMCSCTRFNRHQKTQKYNGFCTHKHILYNYLLAHISMCHYQPINVPTAGAQAFLMDYPQGERAITHHASPVRIGGY
jgi:hypothetical protein